MATKQLALRVEARRWMRQDCLRAYSSALATRSHNCAFRLSDAKRHAVGFGAGVHRGLSSAKRVVDLRSDTVTRPSQRMRERMASAVVGDDVYGEDPTVNELQAKFAALLGKEEAVFVPSGTMGNLVAVLAHANRGDQVILGDKTHLYQWEAGHLSSLASCVMTPVPNQDDGTIALADLEAAVCPDDPHYPRARMIALENTHGGCAGAAVPSHYTDQVGQLCSRLALRLHIDGARLLNAAVALRQPPSALVRRADSVSVCLSKGLGAPVGSIVAGGSDFIYSVRRWRKAVGGSMRQSGVLAAAGLEALAGYEAQLQADHTRAQALREGLSSIEGVRVHTPAHPSNFVVFRVDRMPAADFCDRMLHAGVLIYPYGGMGEDIRAVTHCDVSDDDIEHAVASARAMLAAA